MFRLIAGVIVGYVVMAVLIIAAFGLAILSPDFAFEKERFEVTPAWLAISLATSIVAAIVGGFVAVWIGKRRAASYALAVLAFVLGMGSAVDNLKKPRPAETESPIGMTFEQRASKTAQPNWYAFTLPLIGVAGIILGGRICKERR